MIVKINVWSLVMTTLTVCLNVSGRPPHVHMFALAMMDVRMAVMIVPHLFALASRLRITTTSSFVETNLKKLIMSV